MIDRASSCRISRPEKAAPPQLTGKGGAGTPFGVAFNQAPRSVGCQVKLPRSGAAGQADSTSHQTETIVMMPRTAVMCSLMWSVAFMVSLLCRVIRWRSA